MTKRSVILVFTIVWFVTIGGIMISSAEHKAELSGTISSINAAEKSIIIKDEKGKETTITGVDEKSLGQLKPGDTVVCMYASEGGKNVCKGIMKKEEKKKPVAPGY